MKNARVGITSQFGVVNNQNRCKFCDAEDNILRRRWMEMDGTSNRPKPYYKNKTWSTNMSTEGQKAHLFKYHQIEIKGLIAEYYNTHDIPNGLGGFSGSGTGIENGFGNCLGNSGLNLSNLNNITMNNNFMAENKFQLENNENMNEVDGLKTDFKSELPSIEQSSSLKQFCSQFLNNSELEKLTGELDGPVMNMGVTDSADDKLKIEDNSPQMPQKVEITLTEYTRLLETERKYNQLKLKFNEINSIFLS